MHAGPATYLCGHCLPLRNEHVICALGAREVKCGFAALSHVKGQSRARQGQRARVLRVFTAAQLAGALLPRLPHPAHPGPGARGRSPFIHMTLLTVDPSCSKVSQQVSGDPWQLCVQGGSFSQPQGLRLRPGPRPQKLAPPQRLQGALEPRDVSHALCSHSR